MSRDMTRGELLAVGRRAVRQKVFDKRRSGKPLTEKGRREATNVAFEAIRRADPTTGTSYHPFAAYSHGVWDLAAQATSAEVRRSQFLHARAAYRRRVTKHKRSR
jgi:hypothetical protein